ncbi:zinc-ribbon domain-containing protein [Pseudomonas sp. TSRC2-2]|uniref:zinc-ribbon domain-containing protein n=1 Tax=unclassified Pseudomonas TaxID=196821 RepID=UPI003CFB840E
MFVGIFLIWKLGLFACPFYLHSGSAPKLAGVMNKQTTKTIEGMRQLAKSRGGECLSAVYQNLSTRLSWRCADGHEWLADPYRVTRGSWCPVCARLQRRDTLHSAQQVAVKRGGLCLSHHYESRLLPMEWQCQFGHRWQATFASIAQGRWCPTCAKLARRDTLENMQAIATERGGRCLSEIYVSCADSLLWECAQGHRWQAVPSSVKYGRWCPHCAKNKLRGNLQAFQAIALTRGGECLSSEYINSVTPLTWRCAQGHTWKAAGVSVKQGTWCRQCYYDSMRSNIKNMRIMAQARGGKCLSEDYVDASTKLQWQCSVGHTWRAIPHSITQGRWCPECSHMAKCRNEQKRRKYLGAG